MSKLVFHLFHFLEAQGKQYSEPLLCQPERIFTFFHHSYGDSLKSLFWLPHCTRLYQFLKSSAGFSLTTSLITTCSASRGYKHVSLYRKMGAGQ